MKLSKGSALTIVDVAERAGVSVSTVSRVLNSKTDVARSTRERVETAVSELGFSPQITAQRLAGGRSHTVAMLFPSAKDHRADHDIDFVFGAAEATAGRDYYFALATEPLTSDDLVNTFRSGVAEGAILMQVSLSDWRVRIAADLNLPCVLIGRTDEVHELSWVDFDFEGAVSAMVDHLVAIGHRAIGFIGRPREALESGLGSAIRLQRGYEKSMVRHGLEPLAATAEIDATAAAQSVLHLVDSRPDISAFVATHAAVEVGAVRALASRGLEVPRDVSVMTLASTRSAILSTPALSGVDFPSEQLGYQAAHVLVRELDSRAAGRPRQIEQILLPAELVLRASTAPPLS